jgi:NNP family nitrate/nitrite transporter-like MFS transporter
VFLQPLLAVCFFPAGFAALARIGPAGSRSLAVSLAIPIAFLLGGGAVPTLIGFMGDAVSFAAGIMLVGVLITVGALLAGRLRLR